jgi:hypothetical protein
VLAMTAIGAVCAAVWLRYRAPVKDRGALGPFGWPPFTFLTAALLVVTGAVGETFLPAGAWLAWLVALDLLGLVLLRQAIHVGLLEEAQDREIGPEVRCANCGAMTATHTFCNNCGISLKALPKVPDAAARGSFPGRLTPAEGHWSGARRLLPYAAGLALVGGIAVAIGALTAPPGPKARCRPHVPCGAPPIFPQFVTTLPGYTPWQSSAFGFWLRYNGAHWSVPSGGSAPDHVVLEDSGSGSLVIVHGASSSSASPAEEIGAEVNSLRSNLLGFTSDTNPDDQVLGTNVGFVPGPGGVYTGTIATSQGPQAPVAVAVVAAAQRGVTISVEVLALGGDPNVKAFVYDQADDIINSIKWS